MQRGQQLRRRLAAEDLPQDRLDARDLGARESAFNVHSAAATLKGLEPADKRKLLELVASVNDADDELDLAEDAYLRNVAVGIGVPEAEIADLTLEVLDDEELFGMLQ